MRRHEQACARGNCDREEWELTSGQEHVDQMVIEVEITSLSTADSPRVSGEDAEHVAALAEAQAPLPPIIVHRATMRVIDGQHRLRAAELRGHGKIAIRYFDGDEADAFVLAVESNTTHGLPLSLTDRKAAAERIITSHPQWSDRMIASVAGMAPGTVAEIRRRTPVEVADDGSRIGQDGRVRPINSSEGRRLASELIAGNPALSLRQIARAAGISPETARDVRNRLERGEDPLPQRRGRVQATPETGPTGLRDVIGTEHARGASLVPAPAVAPAPAPAQDRMAAFHRLKADPAVRLSETGRRLLWLLNLHTISSEEWDEIIASIPPHCTDVVTYLANECAGIWAELALRTESRVAGIA